jgi:ATP-dependent protease Clp ATPase subunit
VSGRGVQTTLLKLMEETDVPLRSANDLQSQLQAAFEFQKRGGKAKKETISTRHVLFRGERSVRALEAASLEAHHAGADRFNAESRHVMDNELFQHVKTQDFIEYGFEPEFIGRLPVRVVCEGADGGRSLQDHEVLRREHPAAVRAGVPRLRHRDQLRGRSVALDRRRGAKEKTGARGLLTVWEKLFRDFKYYLAGSGLTQLRVSTELVSEPKRVLERLMAEGPPAGRSALVQSAQVFAEHFQKEHGSKSASTNRRAATGGARARRAE